MGEIITVQIGGFANFIGSHFWNIQSKSYSDSEQLGIDSEIDTEILWRSATTASTSHQVVKYTPRLVVVDLKGGRGALSKDGIVMIDTPKLPTIDTWERSATVISDTAGSSSRTHEAATNNDASSSSSTTTKTTTTTTTNNTSSLSPKIEYWSDYLSVDYHPWSIFELKEHTFGVDKFDKYTDGMHALKDASKKEEVTNQIRHFVEECSSPQGFHIIADVDNGFGAVASTLIDDMQDEFGKLPTITFGVSPYDNNLVTHDQRILNTVLSHTCLSQASSLYIPITCQWPHLEHRLNYDVHNNYHTSAIIAQTLDTATSNYRTFSRNMDMHGLVAAHSPTSEMNVCVLRTSSPVDVAPTLLGNNPPSVKQEITYSLIPTPKKQILPWHESVILRGTGNVPHAVLKEKMVKIFDLPRSSNICMIHLPFSAPPRFPSFSLRGNLSAPSSPVTSVVTRLQSTKSVYYHLHHLSRQIKSINPQQHHDYFADNELDFREICEDINNKAEAYAPMTDDDGGDDNSD